ncbi:hypothetical protein GCM10010924_56940 [Rhizobium wenxiniae]|uniref:Uncharacterized protein n=1 Tax=Rhizobium wenxiniae TaxID=1737357 RepID=A0A7W9YC78_9HYPH|nr:hypothetical protein [Rhizobium wenxiniae]GGG20169.1 hypothetical protein GCM10010924_56940 [Rhizobium wenxiniae]
MDFQTTFMDNATSAPSLAVSAKAVWSSVAAPPKVTSQITTPQKTTVGEAAHLPKASDVTSNANRLVRTARLR